MVLGKMTLVCNTLHSTRAACIWKGYSERRGSLRSMGVIRIGLVGHRARAINARHGVRVWVRIGPRLGGKQRDYPDAVLLYSYCK